MKLTVYDRKANTVAGQRYRLANLIESETRFGMGCEFNDRHKHDVMDEDRTVSPVTQRHHDKAWKQLGTSGSGNHFVEFGRSPWTRSRRRRSALNVANTIPSSTITSPKSSACM